MYIKVRVACHELEQLRKIQLDEDREIERLEVYAQGLGGAGYGEDAPTGSHTGDRLERATLELSEYKETVKRLRRARTEHRAALLYTLWQNLDGGAAYVAEAIYNRGLSYKEIAAESGYSLRWVYLQDEKVRRA